MIFHAVNNMSYFWHIRYNYLSWKNYLRLIYGRELNKEIGAKAITQYYFGANDRTGIRFFAEPPYMAAQSH